MDKATRALAALIAAAPLLAAAPAPAGEGRAAPPNPAFVRYLQTPLPQRAAAAMAGPGRALGYIPGPTIPVQASTAPAAAPKKAAYAASYDLRTLGKVTSVKNQGSCGDCWAYGAMASLESYLLPGESIDLSEDHMDRNHGFDWASCAGGNNYISAAYMARWNGPALEGSSDVVKHAQNIVFIPPRASSTDNDRIKDAIVNYGAVGASYYHSDGYYNSGSKAYYANVSSQSFYSNHLIAVVGWDDNYSKSNFSTNPLGQPAGNGAFICKNSWGDTWGDSGYFYASYYDGVFAKDSYSAVFTGEGVKNYTRQYGYDDLGWEFDYGYGSVTGWAAAIFTAGGSESLKGVGFYTTDTATSYNLYVYTGVTAGSPRSGSLKYSGSGSFSAPGFHTVSVGYVSLSSGELFSVVLELTNAAYTYPVPLEARWDTYTGGAAASGNSYISADGAAWTGMPASGYSNVTYTDVNIKAFGSDQPPKGVVALTDNLFRPVRNPAVQCDVNVTIFAAGNVSVKVYTTTGALVRTLYNGPQAYGATSYKWDGRTDGGAMAAAGLYLISVKGPNTNSTEKVVLIK